jgi:hypothetical protein
MSMGSRCISSSDIFLVGGCSARGMSIVAIVVVFEIFLFENYFVIFLSFESKISIKSLIFSKFPAL